MEISQKRKDVENFFAQHSQFVARDSCKTDLYKMRIKSTENKSEIHANEEFKLLYSFLTHKPFPEKTEQYHDIYIDLRYLDTHNFICIDTVNMSASLFDRIPHILQHIEIIKNFISLCKNNNISIWYDFDLILKEERHDKRPGNGSDNK